MSKRSYLRKTALGFAATASVCAATDNALAQIDLNGGTFNANGVLSDGSLNARYWHQNLLSVFTGPVSNPPPNNNNNFKPFTSFNAATQFLNGVDGNGINNALDTNFAQPLLAIDLDFPAGNGNDGPDGNPFTGVAIVDPDNHMGAWSGQFNATESGVHTFWTASDDASMLFIDGQIVVNNNAQQGMTERSGTVNLTPGNHEIMIVFQEAAGGSGMTANWQSPTGTKAFINPSATPTNFRSYAASDNSTQQVNVNANSTIDVQASKALFGDLALNNAVLALTGTRLADRTTFGNATATGASGINNTVDASLASLNAGGTPLTTFTKSGIGGLRVDGTSSLTNTTNVVVQGGTLAINATGGAQGLGTANINLAGGTLGISNADATPATLANAIQVSASSGINVGAGGMGPAFGGANLGTVTFTPGTTLTKTGANGVNLAIATTSVPGGGAITYNVADGGLNTAAYSSGGAALTVNKTGGGQLNLTQVGTNLNGGSFNVQAGTLAATNDAVGTTLGNTPVTLAGGRLLLNTVGSPQGFVEGLTVGYLAGNFNATTENAPNPGTAPNGLGGVRLDVIHGNNINTPPWVGDNETWVYSGQIFTDDGTFSLAEHIDDNVLIRIDGAQVLRDTAWNVPSFVPVTTTPGWHDFEVRFGEGGGGQGPAARAGGAPSPGWTGEFGFGYSPDLQADANGANYILPIEPAGGGETLFRTQTFSGATYSAPITVTANSTVDLAGNATSIQLGNIAMQNGANLTINGSRATTIPQVSVAAGTTSSINANIGGQSPLSIQNVQVPTAQLNINGTADVTGTVTGGKLVRLSVGTVNVKSTATFSGAAGIETALGGVMRFDAAAGTINASAVAGNQLNNGSVRAVTGTTSLANAMLTSTAPPQGTGAVAHYSFDEGSGTTANDTGLAPNNVGTLGTGAQGTGNGPDWTTDPADRKFGTSSLRFDATASQRDMVVVQDEASLNPTTQISFSAWINATDWNGNRRVLQKSQGNSDTQYRFLAENGEFHFRLEPAGAPGSLTAPLPPVGQWVHVVGQYDGSAMELFYDGVSVARRAVTAPLAVTTGTLRLGTKEESVTVDGDYFNGILDEIYIFGRGLNRREIIALSRQQHLDSAEQPRHWNCGRYFRRNAQSRRLPQSRVGQRRRPAEPYGERHRCWYFVGRCPEHHRDRRPRSGKQRHGRVLHLGRQKRRACRGSGQDRQRSKTVRTPP